MRTPYPAVTSEMCKESDGLNSFAAKRETSDRERRGNAEYVPKTHLVRQDTV